MPGCLPGGGTGRWNGVSTLIGKELVARKRRRAFWPRPTPWPCTVPPARPPGTGASFSSCAMPRHRWHVPHGRGNAPRFLVPTGEAVERRRCHGGGHRPCHSAALIPGQPGAEASCQRPPRPRRALPARRAGRWPLLFPDLPVCGEPSRAGGGNAVRFLIPPGEAVALTMPECPVPLARGHRPCHSARLIPGQPGAQSPRPAPDPPMAGASRPPGRALACRWCGRHGSWRQRSARAGETQCVSFSRPERRRKVRVRTASAVAMAGAIAPATARR
jgi:hypothetical protein